MPRVTSNGASGPRKRQTASRLLQTGGAGGGVQRFDR